MIPGTPPVDDARDRGLGVDPHGRLRRTERDDELFSREDGDLRAHEHSVGRQIECEVGDEAKIALANDLARQADLSAKCATVHRTGKDCAHGTSYDSNAIEPLRYGPKDARNRRYALSIMSSALPLADGNHELNGPYEILGVTDGVPTRYSSIAKWLPDEAELAVILSRIEAKTGLRVRLEDWVLEEGDPRDSGRTATLVVLE
jgi:hypothetical protein